MPLKTRSVFHIESDDIKGKIIGQEESNIRALEVATSVDIIIDDTPQVIVISGFDLIRRETARLSLYWLVQDGVQAALALCRLYKIPFKIYTTQPNRVINIWICSHWEKG